MPLFIIGQNNQAGKSILKTDYKEDSPIDFNLKLAVKILMKTMDSSSASPERIELSVLRKNSDESISLVTLTDAEVPLLAIIVFSGSRSHGL